MKKKPVNKRNSKVTVKKLFKFKAIIPQDNKEMRDKIRKDTNRCFSKFILALKLLGFDFNQGTTYMHRFRYKSKPTKEGYELEPAWLKVELNLYRVKEKNGIVRKIPPESIENRIKQQLLSLYSKPVVYNKLKKFWNNFDDKTRKVFSYSKNLFNTVGLSQNLKFPMIQIDIDMENGHKIFKRLRKKYFQNKLPMYYGISIEGHIHAIFRTNEVPSSELLHLLDEFFELAENLSCDFRIENRTQRLPFSLKYHNGYLDENGDFIIYEDFTGLAKYLKGFDFKKNAVDLSKLAEVSEKAKAKKEKEDAKKEKAKKSVKESATPPEVIEAVNPEEKSSNKKSNWNNWNWGIDVFTKSSKISSNSNFSIENMKIGRKKKYQILYKEGKAAILYRHVKGNKEKFKSILKSCNNGSRDLTKDFENEWKKAYEFGKNAVDNSSYTKKEDISFDNTRFVKDISKLIRRVSNVIVKKHIKRVDWKKKWLDELPGIMMLFFGNYLYQRKSNFTRIPKTHNEVRDVFAKNYFYFGSIKKFKQIKKENNFTISLYDAKKYIIQELFDIYKYKSGATYVPTHISEQFTFKFVDKNLQENSYSVVKKNLKLNLQLYLKSAKI